MLVTKFRYHNFVTNNIVPICKTYQGQKLLFNKPNPLTPGGAAQVSTESPIVTSSIIPSETIKPIMQVYSERKLISIRTPLYI